MYVSPLPTCIRHQQFPIAEVEMERETKGRIVTFSSLSDRHLYRRIDLNIIRVHTRLQSSIATLHPNPTTELRNACAGAF